MLLALLALGFELLLTLHFLGYARLSKRLSFAALVRFRIESRFERCVGAHARYDFAAELLLKLEQSKRFELDAHFYFELVAELFDGQLFELGDAVFDLLADEVLALFEQLVWVEPVRLLNGRDFVRLAVGGHGYGAHLLIGAVWGLSLKGLSGSVRLAYDGVLVVYDCSVDAR